MKSGEASKAFRVVLHRAPSTCLLGTFCGMQYNWVHVLTLNQVELEFEKGLQPWTPGRLGPFGLALTEAGSLLRAEYDGMAVALVPSPSLGAQMRNLLCENYRTDHSTRIFSDLSD